MKPPKSVIEASNALEKGFNEAMTLTNIRERIFTIVENVKAYTPSLDSAGSIFCKRRRPNLSSFQSIPRTISMEIATPEEVEMIKERSSAITQVWNLIKEYPRPYETISKLIKENDRLKEDVELATLPKEEIKQLEEENARLMELIERMRSLTEKLREHI